MKVVIASGGRFWSQHLAHQLEMRHALEKLITFSYTKNDRNYVSPQLVTNITRCALIDKGIELSRLTRFVSASRINLIKDTIFDHALTSQLDNFGLFDIFVGWANYFSHSVPAIRSHGATIILESGSCHITTQQLLLEHEYRSLGLSFTPINKKNRERMLREYDAADYIMNLSAFSRDSFIAQGIPRDKVLYVPCGTNISYFNERTPVQRSTKFRVIFVGLMQVRKGVHHLIKAWQKLQLPEDKAELLLVGNLHKDMAQVLAQTTLPKSIKLVGAVSQAELRDLYQSSSLFVLPSIEDGFGMVIGEAMASRLPILTTTQAGGQELITEGEEGFVVPAGNADALAEKISWFYNNQEAAQAMGSAAHKTIQHHSWDEYGEQMYATYQQVLRKGSLATSHCSNLWAK